MIKIKTARRKLTNDRIVIVEIPVRQWGRIDNQVRVRNISIADRAQHLSEDESVSKVAFIEP